MDQSGFKALILGATGATGRELVTELVNSSKWSEVYVIVRRSLPQWEQLQNKQKLKVHIVDNLDLLENAENWKFQNLNTLFCCLGARTKEGDAQFTKVDLTYPQYGVKIAQLNKIPHYSLVSSGLANPNSWFLYLRIKGLAEESVIKGGFRMASLHQPGAILNRHNDERFVDSILKYMKFLPNIDAADLAKAIRIEAEKVAMQLPTEVTTKRFSNEELINLSRSQ